MKSCASSRSGLSGGTTVVSRARLRTRSTAALVRNTPTSSPAARPPQAIVKPTEESSWSVPRVKRLGAQRVMERRNAF
jgi:hypothetical protein